MFDSEIEERSLRSVARHAQLRRARKNRGTPVGMTHTFFEWQDNVAVIIRLAGWERVRNVWRGEGGARCREA